MRFIESGSVNLTRSDCRALLAFAAADKTRPHLRVIHVDAAARTVVATDGRTLLTIDDRCAGDIDAPAYSVPRQCLVDALRLAKGARGSVELSASSITCTPDKGDARTVTFAVGDEQYPPYRQIVPTHDGFASLRTIRFNAALFARTALVTKAAGVDACDMFFPDKSCDPIRVEAIGNGCIYTAIIMPMRA